MKPTKLHPESDRSGLNVPGARHRFLWNAGDALTLSPDVHFDLYAANVSSVMANHSLLNRNIPCWVAIQTEGGIARVQIAEEEPLTIRSGEAILLPASVPHSICGTSKQVIISRWSHFNFKIMNTVDLLSLLEIPRVYRGVEARRIGQLNNNLAALGNVEDHVVRTAVRLNALGFELLEILMGSAQIRPEAKDMLAGGCWYNLTKQIHEQLPTDIVCEELAHRVGLSTTQFFVAFHRIFRMSPMAYVREARLHMAQRLLLYTDLNISQIAGKVSPWEVSQFSRFFLRESGMRPLEYRLNSRVQ